MSSSERFGYEWDKYHEMTPEYESQFRNWVGPLAEKDFSGRKVLDAGCGMGRNSYWPLIWGASSVTAFDLDSRSVAKAKTTLANFSNVTVAQKSIYDLPWKNEFDIAMSIGVVHHLGRPKEAINQLVASLKSGGRLVVWVYSYEGYEWVVNYLNPFRTLVTARLPLFLVHVISYCLSIPLWLYLKITRGGHTLYLKQISTFKFWHLHSIVFDQLIPDVANYWTKDQVTDIFSHPDLVSVSIQQPGNRCGWTIIGVKR